MIRPSLGYLALIGGVGLVYFLSGKLGLLLAFVHPSATAVWPPTGIALALLLLLGYRIWPALLLGAFFVNITTAGTVLTSLGIASGNTLEGVLGAALVRRFARGRQALERPGDIFRFAVLAALASTTVSAGMGVMSLCLGGYAAWGDYGSIWMTWWLGDAVGNLVVAPPILLWSADRRVSWSRARGAEAAVSFAALLLVAQAVLGAGGPLAARHLPLGFFCVPPLLWIAYRFGAREAATATLLLSAVALAGTLSGAGPFATGSRNESLLLLQAFMGILSFTALLLAGALGERRRAEEALRRSEEQNRLILEKALDGVFTTDSSGVITAWNPEAERMFGWPREAALGRKLSETILPERHRKPNEHGLQRFLTTGRSPGLSRRVSFTGIRRDGQEFPVEMTITVVSSDDGILFAGFVRDLTERN